jgi:hypothetical protein
LIGGPNPDNRFRAWQVRSMERIGFVRAKMNR